MASHFDETHQILISEDDVRGGVTGHNVRYVLGFGLTGVIAAFAAIAIYFGFGRLQADFTAGLAKSPSALLQNFAPYAAIVLMGALIAGLLLGCWHAIAGPSGDESESFMRTRVVTQFALVCVIMATFYVAGY